MHQQVGPTLIPFPWQYFKSYQPSSSHLFPPPIATPFSSFIAPFIVKSTLCIFQPSSAIFKNSFFLFKQTPSSISPHLPCCRHPLQKRIQGGNKKLKAGGKLMYLFSGRARCCVEMKFGSPERKEGQSCRFWQACHSLWLYWLTGWLTNRVVDWLTD